MKSHREVMKELSADERAKVMARTRELLAEEIALQHLRKARHLTQERMAELLGVGQDSISRLERRSDLLISTLQSYIKAMGGTLKLVVQFRDGMATLSGLGEMNVDKIHTPKAPPRKRASSGSHSKTRGHLELIR